MTGTDDYTKGVELLRAQYNIKIIFVTLGKDGSRAYYKDIMAEQPTFSPTTRNKFSFIFYKTCKKYLQKCKKSCIMKAVKNQSYHREGI